MNRKIKNKVKEIILEYLFKALIYVSAVTLIYFFSLFGAAILSTMAFVIIVVDGYQYSLNNQSYFLDTTILFGNTFFVILFLIFNYFVISSFFDNDKK